jgi:hypothetical protein
LNILRSNYELPFSRCVFFARADAKCKIASCTKIGLTLKHGLEMPQEAVRASVPDR